jgi:DNA-directed RNA polymerase subunit K/omega
MSDDTVQMGEETEPGAPESAPQLPRMAPIDSRFLFVNVAAHRAKQLRRGALPRLDALRPDPQTGARPAVGHKLERVAMAEVGEGLIVYEAPPPRPLVREAEA